jgi:recombination protein RecA
LPLLLAAYREVASLRFMVPSHQEPTLCQHVIAEAQKRDGLCAFIDMEHALDQGYAARCGVDVRNLYISQPDTGEQSLSSPF